MTFVRELRRLRPEPAPDTGPLVSVVVINLDGADQLERLLHGLENRTSYRPIELVLVDRGSSDGSLTRFKNWNGPATLVTAIGASPASATNKGIAEASGELALLASNGIDPSHAGWLGYLVQSLEDSVAAVGALLISPKRGWRTRVHASPGHGIKQRGAHFAPSEWGVRAVGSDMGGDPLGLIEPARRDVPLASAACLLARRSHLLETMLDESYTDGYEDWDLCLRLGNLGRIVVDERAALFDHGASGDDQASQAVNSVNSQSNHDLRRFNELWGPAILRRLRAEITDPGQASFYRGVQPPAVHLDVGTTKYDSDLVDRLSRGAQRLGWRVLDEPTGPCDLTVAVAPPTDPHEFAQQTTSVAIVDGHENLWAASGALDAATRVVAFDAMTARRLAATWGAGIPMDLERGHDPFGQLLAILHPQPDAIRIGVSTCTPDWERAQYWGDTHLARGLMRAFRRLGHEAVELIRQDWHGASAASCDAVVHLRGRDRRPVARGQWNILWIMSHPDTLEAGECDDYDIVASASHRHALALSEAIGREVHFLPQAADADTFRVTRTSSDYEEAVLYVGNARWPHRRAPRWLVRSGTDFHIYGKNWDRYPESAKVRGEYIPNKALATAYRSAAVVVADHHGSLRSEGFLANRLFDVLASGGVVLSDDVAGLREIFGDIVPQYSTYCELASQVEALLADESRRRRIRQLGRKLVMEHHTLDHRAHRILALLDELPGPAG